LRRSAAPAPGREIITDLDSLTETEIAYDGKRFIVRSAPRPAADRPRRLGLLTTPNRKCMMESLGWDPVPGRRCGTSGHGSCDRPGLLAQEAEARLYRSLIDRLIQVTPRPMCRGFCWRIFSGKSLARSIGAGAGGLAGALTNTGSYPASARRGRRPYRRLQTQLKFSIRELLIIGRQPDGTPIRTSGQFAGKLFGKTNNRLVVEVDTATLAQNAHTGDFVSGPGRRKLGTSPQPAAPCCPPGG
jgi:hypothetical protein